MGVKFNTDVSVELIFNEENKEGTDWMVGIYMNPVTSNNHNVHVALARRKLTNVQTYLTAVLLKRKPIMQKHCG